MKNRPSAKKMASVSASELAQMGVCERLVVFEHRYGKRRSREQREAMRRGVDEHERFYREGIDASARRGRCYIATLVFGASRETAILRQFREQILRPSCYGRWVIKVYYQTAPTICRCLEHRSLLQRIVREALHPIVWLANLCLAKKGRNRER
jgi:hypothetical protein